MITRLVLDGIQATCPPPALRRPFRPAPPTLLASCRVISAGPADFWAGSHPGAGNPIRWWSTIERLAQIIRQEAEVFVLVGIGGSNRGAQAVIEALGDRRVEIVYAGDNLSAHALQRTLRRIQGRSTILNVIAKDFNTLEPGIAFRMLRQQLAG